MPIPTLPHRRIALLGLLLVSLAVLAEGVARVELAHAVSAAWTDGGGVVVYVTITDD